MKKTDYIIITVGLLCVLFFGINMFTFWVMNDMLWLSTLFIGLLLYFWAEYRATKREEPLSAVQKNRKKSKLSSCITAMCLCALVLLLIITKLIESI